jgi:voltage-gated potassium channel
MQKWMKTIYESMMILLVMLTIITLWTENTYNSTINWIVWGIFFVDFLIRFLLSKEKWIFIKQNPFLVIAIIPFDQFFQVARIVRVIYLFRIKTITKYYISPFVDRLTYKSKTLILTMLILLFLTETFLIWNLESSITTYADALFVLLSHLLFFGHKIFEIENTIAIWTLTGVSIIGVVLQGLALQWAFSKTESFYSWIKQKGHHSK